MVDFHWLHSVSFVRVHACVIHDWFVEVFSLVSKDSIIGSALHDAEVVGPLGCQLEVFLGGGERVGLAFLKRHAGLAHQLLNILMSLFWQAFELFDFGVLAAAHIRDTGKLVRRVGVPDPKARAELLGRLVEVLSEERVQLVVVMTCGHMETVVPVGQRVSPTMAKVVLMVRPCRELLPGGLGPAFHFVLDHLWLLLSVIDLLLLWLLGLIVHLLGLIGLWVHQFGCGFFAGRGAL